MSFVMVALQDVLCKILVLVIQSGKGTASGAEYESINELVALSSRESKLESIAEQSSCAIVAGSKAWQVRVALHEFHQQNEAFSMLTSVSEASAHESLELIVSVAVHATEDIDVVAWEFERGCLEADPTGRQAQDEAKVDVNEMPFGIHENIAIMTVFDLQEVRDDSIASE